MKLDLVQAKPRMFGDANHATDFFKNEFMMGAEHSVAIQAVHGATHTAHIGVKYTWFGSGYISNMFYKMIANKPTYRFQRGGDLRWGPRSFNVSPDPDIHKNIFRSGRISSVYIVGNWLLVVGCHTFSKCVNLEC